MKAEGRIEYGFVEMPRTNVLFYQDKDGTVPVLSWLSDLVRKGQWRVAAKCRELIRRLELLGFELRRPLADMLRNGIYELRAKRGRVNYRLLYFFHGRNTAVLVHALTKKGEVPDADIERALQRKRIFEQAPHRHSYREARRWPR